VCVCEREKERERGQDLSVVEGLGGEGFAPHGEKPSHLLQVGGARLIGSQRWSICKEGVSLMGSQKSFIFQ